MRAWTILSFPIASLLLAGCAESGADLSDAGQEIAAAVSGSEIFVVSLPNDRAEVEQEPLLNVTNRRGYDNQPCFVGDGSALLYSSIRDGRQSEVHYYGLTFGEHRRITYTLESEYSPTIMPGGEHFSSVRVAPDGTQQLWTFSMDGSLVQPLLPSLNDVGYHAWLDEHRVAVFITGDPSSLAIADTESGELREIARNVGRSLHKVPGDNELSFVDKSNEKRWLIRAYNWETGRISTLIAALPESEDFDWTPQGELLMAKGKRLYIWKRGWIRWRRLANWDHVLPGDINRLAVSGQGDWLALVVAESKKEPIG